MRPFVVFALVGAFSAAAYYAAHCQGIPPADLARIEARIPDDSWSPPTHLPPGAEYHLLRESPKTHGIQAVARFPAGYAVREHTHECDETFVVIRGKLWIKIGDREEVLGPGGFAVLPAGVPHALGSKTFFRKTVFVTVTDGPYDVRFTEDGKSR